MVKQRLKSQSFSPSLLIVGGDEEGRAAKAEEIIGKKLSLLSQNPDFLLVSAEGDMGIEAVKNLQRFLVLKPFGAGQKIVFVKEAQNLTREAQNSLLKTLEEPPNRSLIILTAPDPALLLTTIVSRCTLIELPLKPQISLSVEENREMDNLLAKLLSATVGERFIILEGLGLYQDREKSLTWLNQLTVVVRQKLFDTPQNQVSGPNWLSLLKAIGRAKKCLQANTNVRLTMEIFLSEI